jgi:hypothetical protein
MTHDLPDAEGGAAAVKSPRARSPAKEICILLPVWGSDFISEFLVSGLPTLLAPGNIPALAASLPTRFVLRRAAAGARNTDPLG